MAQPRAERVPMRPFEKHVEHELSALKSLRRALDKWLQGGGLPDPPRAGIVLATHEALANAIEHSNSAKPIHIKAEAHSDGFVIEITDDGQWKIPETPRVERGRGLHLIKALVSDVQINSQPTGTTVRLFQQI
jgi:anti-sigma regulatory factor (Ser/Thr protein kinase)